MIVTVVNTLIYHHLSVEAIVPLRSQDHISGIYSPSPIVLARYIAYISLYRYLYIYFIFNDGIGNTEILIS